MAKERFDLAVTQILAGIAGVIPQDSFLHFRKVVLINLNATRFQLFADFFPQLFFEAIVSLNTSLL